ALVILAAVEAGGWVAFLGVLVVINAAVAAFYYLRVVVYMYMREPVSEVEPPRHGRLLWSGLAVVTALTIVLGFFPFLITGLIGQAAPALAGGGAGGPGPDARRPLRGDGRRSGRSGDGRTGRGRRARGLRRRGGR